MTLLESQRIERVKLRLERIGLTKLAWSIARRTGYTLNDILGHSRTSAIVSGRHELWSVMHGTLGMTPTELRRLFEVDHGTVYVALRKRERELREGAAA